MGGMWSLKLLTEVMIFMTVVRRVVSMALRTLARSIFYPCVRRAVLPLLSQTENVPLCVYVREREGEGTHHSPSSAPRP